MEWTTVTTIIALAGFVIAIGTPIIKLNTTVSRLAATVETLVKQLDTLSPVKIVRLMGVSGTGLGNMKTLLITTKPGSG